MAKNKKPIKKYTPRPLVFPGLIVANNAFLPVEQALDKLLKTGEILEDEVGIYVYENVGGKLESFEIGIENYIMTCIVLYEMKTKKSIEFPALRKLIQVMVAKEGFDEEDLEATKPEIAVCKKILSMSNSMDIRNVAVIVADEQIKKGRMRPRH